MQFSELTEVPTYTHTGNICHCLQAYPNSNFILTLFISFLCRNFTDLTFFIAFTCAGSQTRLHCVYTGRNTKRHAACSNGIVAAHPV